MQKCSPSPRLLRCQCPLHRTHVQNQTNGRPSKARNVRKLMQVEVVEMQKRIVDAVVGEQDVHCEILGQTELEQVPRFVQDRKSNYLTALSDSLSS